MSLHDTQHTDAPGRVLSCACLHSLSIFFPYNLGTYCIYTINILLGGETDRLDDPSNIFVIFNFSPCHKVREARGNKNIVAMRQMSPVPTFPNR